MAQSKALCTLEALTSVYKYKRISLGRLDKKCKNAQNAEVGMVEQLYQNFQVQTQQL